MTIILQFQPEEKLYILLEEIDVRREEKLKKWFDFKKWLEENQCRRVDCCKDFKSPQLMLIHVDYCGLDIEEYAKRADKAEFNQINSLIGDRN